MGEWKTYSELVEEYSKKIDELNKRLESGSLRPNEKADLMRQLAVMIRSEAQMRPYAEREKERAMQK